MTIYGAPGQLASVGVSAPRPYVGPGDLVAGAAGWWGLRPYNRANLNRAQVVNLRRSSDNATSDFGFSAGVLNQAAIATWGGVSTIGTGSISGTTLTFTGGVVGGQVTGPGVAAGTFITAGSSPNWGVNISQTVASTTLMVANGLFVTTLYDQSGNGHDASQGTTANQPIFLLNVFGTNATPVICNYPSISVGLLSIVLGAGIVQPLTISLIGLQYALVNAAVVSDVTRGGNVISHQAGANTFSLNFGTPINNTSVTDGSPFAAIGVGNGASSVFNMNGTETSGNANTGNLGPSLHLLTNVANNAPGATFVSEFGAWSGGFDAVTRAAQVVNARNYYGF